ncbi:MAG TPA: protein kinase [Chloroflexota bacterium]|nr:protein kinase [Chloroflexota bacterium]
MIDVGSVLLARYKLNARVGAGGMATVYDGEDLLLGRRVAVKIPLPSFASDPAFVARFENEARAAAALAHPNLVGVYDVGEDEGTRFIVMEFVDGETLKDLIRREAPLLPEDLVQVGTQVADALDAAHRRGLVHRDVKPQNILLTPEGRVKLADFGIALALGAESATRTGTVLGTADYLAPEVARGESATPLSDIYALGVVLYEMCTGQLPYEGDSPLAIALQHIEAEPPRPRAWNPQVPAALEAIVLRAMAKAPGERFQTAAALAEALRAFARGEAVEDTAGRPASAPGAAPDQAATTPWTWGQSLGPSPWAAARPGVPQPTGPTRPLHATPYATTPLPARPPPAATGYASPRWPLLLLGLVSLLCVLGLVPLGMLVYRTRLPAPTPRVAPSGAVAPSAAATVVTTLRAVPDLWATAARTLVPIPAGGVVARMPTGDDVGAALRDEAAGLAEAGLRAAREALAPRLTPRGPPGACAATASSGSQSCGAPDAVRGR